MFIVRLMIICCIHSFHIPKYVFLNNKSSEVVAENLTLFWHQLKLLVGLSEIVSDNGGEFHDTNTARYFTQERNQAH